MYAIRQRKIRNTVAKMIDHNRQYGERSQSIKLRLIIRGQLPGPQGLPASYSADCR